MNLQGALRSDAGEPAPDGYYGLTVRLFDAQIDGALLHEESFGAANEIKVADGVFQVAVGSLTPLPATLFGDHADVWVEVQVDVEPPLPRSRILTVAYAFASRWAATASDVACSGCVDLTELSVDVATQAELNAAIAALADTVYTKAEVDAKVDALPKELYTKAEVEALLAGYLPLSGGTLSGDLSLDQHQLQMARLQNAATAPVSCGPGQEGFIYWDTTQKVTCVCTGEAWSCGLGVKPTPGSEESPAASCLALAGSPSGFYFIDPDGTGPIEAAETHCEMSADVGGWTLVATWDNGTVEATWGSTLVGTPSLTAKFQLPFQTWFPSPTKALVRYLPTGSTIVQPLTGAAWQTSGVGARFAAGSNYLTFANATAATSRQGICFVSGAYDTGYNCDGNSGHVAGAGLFEMNAYDEICNCGNNPSAGPYWKEAFGGCSATTCGATGLVAIYLR